MTAEAISAKELDGYLMGHQNIILEQKKKIKHLQTKVESHEAEVKELKKQIEGLEISVKIARGEPI